MSLKCDAVFEGGGVRGIGHVGAAYGIEKAGYQFQNLVGSSAGAIVASLLAVGYSANELKAIMDGLDYSKFKEENLLVKMGVIGKSISLVVNLGLYNTNYFEAWLNDLCEKKKKTTFGDLKIPHEKDEKYKYKLQVTASDVTNQRLLTLPHDLREFGIEPDSYSIAKAVTMSMSIPFFFKPFHLIDTKGNEHLIVDGGMLSNYPVWILDDGTKNPPYPTFGFKFVSNEPSITINKDNHQKLNIIRYTKLMLDTLLEAHDNQHISKSKGDFDRTIAIPVTIDMDGRIIKVTATDFSINQEESRLLFNNGVNAAEEFLKHWDFNSWKKKYRS